jgi:hypothetical protein
MGTRLRQTGLLTAQTDTVQDLDVYAAHVRRSGNLEGETIWMGDVAVASILPSDSSVAVYYVRTD